MISQIYYCNANKFTGIANDYSDTKTRVEKITKQPSNEDNTIFKCAIESLPMGRRIVGLKDKVENGEYIATAGALAYTAVNAKEDIRDTVSAVKQIYSKINPNFHYDPRYDRYNYQHEFSATRGMIGEKALYESANKGNPFATMIKKTGNTTIDSTRFGQWVSKVFKIKEDDIQKIDKIRNHDGKCAYAYKFESSILGGKTIARAMKRTTVLGVAVMGVLEAPKIISETMKGDSLLEHAKNGAKQIVKSSGNVVLTTAGIALGGAIGAKYIGATGSIVGMGLGAVIGSKASSTLQTAIGNSSFFCFGLQ